MSRHPTIDSVILHSSYSLSGNTDYLMSWIKHLIIQKPVISGHQYKYLYLHGPVKSGKSIFHEMISLLLDPVEYVHADIALRSICCFNGELEHAKLCTIEEELPRRSDEYKRLVSWVNGKDIAIFRPMEVPKVIENKIAWIQCTEAVDQCPAFSKSSGVRVLSLYHQQLEQRLPARQMYLQLLNELPAFKETLGL